MNQVATVAVDSNGPGARKSGPHRGRRSWLAIFVGGLTLWAATVLVTFATQNSNLIPTIILLGSFLVPVTFVTYAFSHADPIIILRSGSSVPSSLAGFLVCSALRFWKRSC
jgi:protease PrsW